MTDSGDRKDSAKERIELGTRGADEIWFCGCASLRVQRASCSCALPPCRVARAARQGPPGGLQFAGVSEESRPRRPRGWLPLLDARSSHPVACVASCWLACSRAWNKGNTSRFRRRPSSVSESRPPLARFGADLAFGLAEWSLTDEGKRYLEKGSPEFVTFSAIPTDGIERAALEVLRFDSTLPAGA